MKVVYDAADSASTWTLTGTSKNAGGFEVNSGTLVLQGANTAHATYSDSGDWTYAILETPGGVTVNDGATFRLSHHALMTADVTVNDGVFEMTDTVKAASESISGGLREDVTGIRSLRGNVSLASADATMKVNTTTKSVALHYDGAISGSGNFEKLGAGKLVLGGANTFSGTKTVTAGMIEFSSFAAMGDTATEKWNIGADGALMVTGEGAAVLDKISGESAGVLALDADVAGTLDLSGHQNLFIGAAAGKTINYGAADLTLATNAAGEWHLGGGGGTLNVLYKLTGTGTLIVGNEVSNGTVYLANANNDFSGSIVIGGFNNFLDYVSLDALGNATFAVEYGNAMGIGDGSSAKMMDALSTTSAGVAALSENSSAAIDFSERTLALGAVTGETVRYTGTLTPHADGYRFGGSGTLILDTRLSDSANIFIDAQGMSGGRIIFAQEDSGFTGAVTAGAKLDASSSVSNPGTIVVGFENGKALANASSFTLKEGAVLDVGGADVELRNVTVNSGSAIKNLGTERRTFTITYDNDATWLAGTFGSGSTAAIDFVKKGAGTLTLNHNNAFVGTMTVEEGTLKAADYNKSTQSSFGLSSAGNSIVVNENGTLDLTLRGYYGTKNFADAKIHQTITGTGTIVVRAVQDRYDYLVLGFIPDYHLSEKTTVLFSQTEAFDGTVKVVDQTRLLVGKNLNGATNVDALRNATVEVESGSQARVTNTVSASSANLVDAYTDFVISGSGYTGADGYRYWATGNGGGVYSRFEVDNGKNAGALSVDCGSTVYGTVTLAANATIASWNYGNGKDGTIRGAILGGADKTLTIAGDRGLTFQADAANDYGNLLVQNANGAEGFALRVNGGAYRSTTSTALGGGTVTLNAGLILRFGNTEKAGNDVVYTYGNAFSLGDGAALESNWNTTRLTGAVTLAGTSATLATRNGSALRLEGGLVGDSTKTANVAAGSLVALGGNAANAFAGTLATGAGTSLTLLDGAAEGGIASTAQIAFTDSLTLSLEGARQFTLASIVGTADAAESTALDLHYDFTSGTGGSSLSAGTLTSDALNVFIDLDSTEKLAGGSYTLLSGGAADGLANYTLATRNDRLSLKLENGALVLTVDADGRLVWKRQDGNAAWDTTTVHWNSEKAGDVAFAAGDSVIFDATGVAAGNSAANRESVTLASETTVGAVVVRDAFYTFSGAGKLSGENASLNVAANGSLRLETSGNAFAQGATVQDGGTLALAASGALTDTALSLKSAGTLSLEASGALAGTTTVVFDGGTLRYGAGATGDVSAFLRAGTDAVKLDLNGNAGVALADLSALSPTNTATIALSNSAYDADAGTGAAGATLGAASGAYETAAGSALEIGAGVSATHFGKGTLGVLSGAGDYTFDGSAGALTVADMTGFTGTAAIVNASSANKLIVTNKSSGTTWRLSGTLGGGISFNDFAASDATLSFEGLNLSWVPHSQTFAQKLVLTNGAGGYGVMFSDGSDGRTTTYTGAVTGDGLFLVTRSSAKATTNDKIKFTGDLSGFAGGFESRADAGGTIAFGYVFSDDGGATVYADNDRALGTGGIKLAGTAELNFAAAHGVANAFSGAGAVTKTGAGELSISGDWSGYAGTLTVGEGAGGLTLSGADQHLAGTYAVADALRVTGTATFDAGAAVSFGSLSVAQGGSLSMSGGVTIAARAGAEAATLGGGATLSHGAIVGATTDDASSELADASATFSGTPEGGFALTNVALENTEVVARNSAALTLTDVALRDNSRLTVKDTASATLAGAFASLGEISVENGGTLTIAGTANLFTIGTSETLPVLATTAGSVVFGDGMFLRLQSEDGSPDFGESGVTVQLFKVLEGATFSGDISAEKISWNGAALGERTTFSFDQNAGTLSFSGSSAYNLTWNGGTEGTWDKTNETAFTIDGTEGTPTRFYNRDAVTFATADARVTLGASIDASAVAAQENLTLSADATNRFHADSVVIDAGKTLTLEGAATAEKAGAYSWEALTLADASSVLDLGAVGGEDAKHVATDDVFGTGTVKVSFNSNSNATYNSTLSLGSGFAGTAYVTAGNFDVSASDIGGGSYRLADGVNVQAAGNSTTVFAGAFTFEGTTDFHTNGGSTFTVNGGLFGSRLDKNGGGTLVVAGETRLDAFTAEAGGGTTNFDGKTSITTADIKNGTTTFNAATTLGTVSLSAGTLNFGANSVAEIETLTQTGGTLTIAGTADVGALALSGSLSAANLTTGALALSNGVTLSLTNSAQDKAVSLGAVSLADGATGTLKIMNNSKNLSLASLSGAAGTTLVLDGNASTMRITNVILGDGTAAAQTGAFAGTLEAKVTAGDGAPRKLAVILNGADLSATTVTFGANSGAEGNGANVKQLGLGLKVDSVIAGLNSDAGMGMGTKVFALNAAATPSNGTENFASGTEARALEIRTAANATHTFCGEVLSNVNVKVTGAGTQIFKGGFAAGSSLTLDSGTATFAATAAGAFAGNLTINGGTFNVSNAGGVNAETLLGTGTSEITINGGALNFVSSRWTIQSGIKLTLAGGSVTGTGIGDGSGTLDFYQSSTVDVRAKAGATAENPTVSTISSPVRYRNYSTTTYDVEAGAKLVHSGEIMKGNYAGIITKTGAGEMLISGSIANGTTIDLDEGMTTISGAVNGGTINVNGGTATLSSGTFNASLKVASGAELRAGAAVSLTTAAQTLKIYVSDAQKGESGAALVTSENGGSVTVSGGAKVYVDISALTLAASAENSESVTLRIASETALMASEGTFEVGWWEGEAWRRFEGIYDYSADMGLLTVAIPEPSAFGLLAGLAALALAGTRRRKRR